MFDVKSRTVRAVEPAENTVGAVERARGRPSTIDGHTTTRSSRAGSESLYNRHRNRSHMALMSSVVR
ncbi:hypothetical protein HSEST_1085 [Halapricum desulfuricans]|uniref:Uncharacterized protein n=1 Tax=Halapricum desulfuricans TaxID=2841257 RepID=A0A897NV90_9EURY|nr:hypothetical protein HSEST_1085 [Halapricum desulfuricans]